MIRDAHTVEVLTVRQRAVLVTIARYTEATGEAPTIAYVARRLAVHRTRIEDVLVVLFRKGWLRSPSPSGLRCTHVPR